MEISEEGRIVGLSFDKVYEQITCSSNKYNFLVYVERKRWLITDDELVTISLQFSFRVA